MTARKHPSWCDTRVCTADPLASTAQGYMDGHGGEHRSAPMAVDLTPIEGVPSGPYAAYLERVAAPWACTTYVRIQRGDTYDPGQGRAIPVGSLGEIVGPLVTLINLAIADDRGDPPARPGPNGQEPDPVQGFREDPEADGAPVPPYVAGHQMSTFGRTRAGQHA